MQTIKAVAYARFSTDMQRDESIDAQLRAIQYYADKYNYEIVGVYADKAKSGRTSDRPQFLQMIADSAKGGFQAVIVHKLDRFSRDSADTLIYERELNKNGVELVSVNERLEKTPEGLLMKQIIIGMNQFYSANLAREVMKGLKENAYNGKHTGGTPPLGYDVGKDMRYVINKKEAEAVKIIFSMYTDGCGYGDIIRELNSRGYRTKINNRFTKNSLYEILRNEKYTGVFIYNKSSSMSANGRFNRHKYKNSDDIIRIEGAVPQIITKEMFDMAQEILDRNKRKKSTYKAKTFYLLGGLLECGSCGASLCGETHRYRNKEYSYYVCVGKKRKHNCTVSNINRDYLDTAVLDELNDVLFSKKNIELICDRIYSSYNNGDEYVQKTKRDLETNIQSLNRKINNLYNAMENSLNANETTKRINALIAEKDGLEVKLLELDCVPNAERKSKQELIDAFSQMANIKNLSQQRQKIVLNRFLDRIVVTQTENGYDIELKIKPDMFNISGLFGYTGGEGGI